MSILEKLLEGVEVKSIILGACTDYEQPTKYRVKSKEYNNDFETPVLTAGKTFILGYTDERDGIYKGSKNSVIIFDDFTTANKWVDFDFKVKSSAMKMITSKDESKALLRYIFHWMNTLQSDSFDGDHKRQWISNYANKKIPIPCPDNPEKSLKIQKEIVRVLDTFTELKTELTAELKTELMARKKQYSYYREQLLCFNESEVEWKTLGEVGKFTYGYATKAKDIGNARFVRISDIDINGKLKAEGKKYVDVSDENSKYILAKNDLLMARTGATYGKTMIFEEDYSAIYAGFLIKLRLDNSLINPKYYWHFAQSNLFWDQAKKLMSGGGQPQFNANVLKLVKLPIPYPNDPQKSLEVQNELINTLNKFDTLTTSISEGLLKEIELRKKQYEYYRNKLLTFPKEKVEA